MTRTAKHTIAFIAVAVLANCGREDTPTAPSEPTSFLAGTWRGPVTIQINPGDPNAPPPSSGEMTWKFEVVPQTNLQSLRAIIRSSDPWLPTEMTGTTAVLPRNAPPTEISTHGQFASPRGCQGTFGSVGNAEATRIEADFTGTDCQLATFTGRVVLTRQ